MSNTAEALFDVDDYANYVHIQVVLCSEHAAQPVVNTGTLHQ